MLRGIGRLRAGGSGLDAAIRALFAAGEEGGWFDPSDFSALFQDSAGTTPVTAVGQPVGLLLDKRLGLAQGSNIAAFSPLDFTTGWSVFAGTTAGSASSFTNASGGESGIYGNHWVAGQAYSVSLSFTKTSGSTTLSLRTAAGLVLFSSTATSGTFSGIRVPTGVLLYLALSNNDTVTITAASAKPVSGNHLTQATGGSRPLEQQPTAFYATKGDGLDDFLASPTGGGGTTGFFYCAAINPSAVGANQTLWADTGTNTGYRVRLNASNQLELSAGNNVAFTTANTTATVTTGTTYVVTAWHDGVNLSVQINSGTVGAIAFGTTTAGTASFTDGATNGGASGFFNGYTFGRVYKKDSGLTAAQRAQVQQYIAAKAGVTL